MYRLPEPFFNKADYTAVLGYSTAHGYGAMNSDRLYHAPYPVYYGSVQPADDFIFGVVLCHKRHYFAFCENSADTADTHFSASIQGERAHLIERDLKFIGHHLQETARAGSALVVHGEVQDLPPISNTDHFRILSSDVDNCSGIGKQVVCP